jgi:hypothetical protein
MEAMNGKEVKEKVTADVEEREGQRGGQGGGRRGSQKWRRGNGWLSWEVWATRRKARLHGEGIAGTRRGRRDEEEALAKNSYREAWRWGQPWLIYDEKLPEKHIQTGP